MVVSFAEFHANVVVEDEEAEETADFLQEETFVASQEWFQDRQQIRFYDHLSVVLVHKTRSLQAP